MAFKHFIGIDVSKLTLDLTLLHGKKNSEHWCIRNDSEAIRLFLDELFSRKEIIMKSTVFGMEHTGIYVNKLVEMLHKRKANVVVDNPLHIKYSMGIVRGKTDKADSARIAAYLFKSRDELSLHEESREILRRLADLSTLRTKLISMRLSLATPLMEYNDFMPKDRSLEYNQVSSKSLDALAQDIKGIEDRIKLVWKSDERLKQLMDILLSIPSIGPVIALQIVICTGEFKKIATAKSFANYAGIAPFPNKSGTRLERRPRVHDIANKKMKSLLHVAATIAVRCVPDIQAYYERKTKIDGKPRMLVINSVRYKLVNRIFTCVNQNRLYRAGYENTFATKPVAQKFA